MAGLVLLVLGAGAIVVGRARWAFIGSRAAAATVAAVGVAALLLGGATLPRPAPDASSAGAGPTDSSPPSGSRNEVDAAAARAAIDAAPESSALAALAAVEVKGRAPRTGYDRDLFGEGWVDVDRNGCDTRNDVLARDLTDETFKPGTNDCVVATGIVADPYSGRTIPFQRGQDTSDDVQIDHVVALSDAWQKGAQSLDTTQRTAFANDPLNLLAVDGPLNQQKSDGDAATWLPPNRSYRCAYVARQVAVKIRYDLWATQAESDAIATILTSCPNEPLPDGVVVPEPAAPLPPAPAPGAPFENCAAARAAGAAPVHRGQPGYGPHLDGNDDGVGCES
ncbi:DUF1524 domain-containing protein [Blastococcus sp. CT_GayMR16]|nr:DUF1524 domain-containing protein [Blastococcus sp. CT_GayMR16]